MKSSPMRLKLHTPFKKRGGKGDKGQFGQGRNYSRFTEKLNLLALVKTV